MFYQEEEQVDERPLAEDLDLHKKACDEVRKVMQDIKTQRDKPSPSKVRTVRML